MSLLDQWRDPHREREMVAAANENEQASTSPNTNWSATRRSGALLMLEPQASQPLPPAPPPPMAHMWFLISFVAPLIVVLLVWLLILLKRRFAIQRRHLVSSSECQFMRDKRLMLAEHSSRAAGPTAATAALSLTCESPNSSLVSSSSSPSINSPNSTSESAQTTKATNDLSKSMPALGQPRLDRHKRIIIDNEISDSCWRNKNNKKPLINNNNHNSMRSLLEHTSLYLVTLTYQEILACFVGFLIAILNIVRMRNLFCCNLVILVLITSKLFQLLTLTTFSFTKLIRLIRLKPASSSSLREQAPCCCCCCQQTQNKNACHETDKLFGRAAKQTEKLEEEDEEVDDEEGSSNTISEEVKMRKNGKIDSTVAPMKKLSSQLGKKNKACSSFNASATICRLIVKESEQHKEFRRKESSKVSSQAQAQAQTQTQTNEDSITTSEESSSYSSTQDVISGNLSRRQDYRALTLASSKSKSNRSPSSSSAACWPLLLLFTLSALLALVCLYLRLMPILTNTNNLLATNYESHKTNRTNTNNSNNNNNNLPDWSISIYSPTISTSTEASTRYSSSAPDSSPSTNENNNQSSNSQLEGNEAQANYQSAWATRLQQSSNIRHLIDHYELQTFLHILLDTHLQTSRFTCTLASTNYANIAKVSMFCLYSLLMFTILLIGLTIKHLGARRLREFEFGANFSRFNLHTDPNLYLNNQQFLFSPPAQHTKLHSNHEPTELVTHAKNNPSTKQQAFMFAPNNNNNSIQSSNKLINTDSNRKRYSELLKQNMRFHYQSSLELSARRMGHHQQSGKHFNHNKLGAAKMRNSSSLSSLLAPSSGHHHQSHFCSSVDRYPSAVEGGAAASNQLIQIPLSKRHRNHCHHLHHHKVKEYNQQQPTRSLANLGPTLGGSQLAWLPLGSAATVASLSNIGNQPTTDDWTTRHSNASRKNHSSSQLEQQQQPRDRLGSIGEHLLDSPGARSEEAREERVVDLELISQSRKSEILSMHHNHNNNNNKSQQHFQHHEMSKQTNVCCSCSWPNNNNNFQTHLEPPSSFNINRNRLEHDELRRDLKLTRSVLLFGQLLNHAPILFLLALANLLPDAQQQTSAGSSSSSNNLMLLTWSWNHDNAFVWLTLIEALAWPILLCLSDSRLAAGLKRSLMCGGARVDSVAVAVAAAASCTVASSGCGSNSASERSNGSHANGADSLLNESNRIGCSNQFHYSGAHNHNHNHHHHHHQHRHQQLANTHTQRHQFDSTSARQPDPPIQLNASASYPDFMFGQQKRSTSGGRNAELYSSKELAGAWFAEQANSTALAANSCIGTADLMASRRKRYGELAAVGAAFKNKPSPHRQMVKPKRRTSALLRATKRLLKLETKRAAGKNRATTAHNNINLTGGSYSSTNESQLSGLDLEQLRLSKSQNQLAQRHHHQKQQNKEKNSARGMSPTSSLSTLIRKFNHDNYTSVCQQYERRKQQLASSNSNLNSGEPMKEVDDSVLALGDEQEILLIDGLDTPTSGNTTNNNNNKLSGAIQVAGSKRTPQNLLLDEEGIFCRKGGLYYNYSLESTASRGPFPVGGGGGKSSVSRINPMLQASCRLTLGSENFKEFEGNSGQDLLACELFDGETKATKSLKEMTTTSIEQQQQLALAADKRSTTTNSDECESNGKKSSNNLNKEQEQKRKEFDLRVVEEKKQKQKQKEKLKKKEKERKKEQGSEERRNLLFEAEQLKESQKFVGRKSEQPAKEKSSTVESKRSSSLSSNNETIISNITSVQELLDKMNGIMLTSATEQQQQQQVATADEEQKQLEDNNNNNNNNKRASVGTNLGNNQSERNNKQAIDQNNQLARLKQSLRDSSQNNPTTAGFLYENHNNQYNNNCNTLDSLDYASLRSVEDALSLVSVSSEFEYHNININTNSSNSNSNSSSSANERHTQQPIDGATSSTLAAISSPSSSGSVTPTNQEQPHQLANRERRAQEGSKNEEKAAGVALITWKNVSAQANHQMAPVVSQQKPIAATQSNNSSDRQNSLKDQRFPSFLPTKKEAAEAAAAAAEREAAAGKQQKLVVAPHTAAKQLQTQQQQQQSRIIKQQIRPPNKPNPSVSIAFNANKPSSSLLNLTSSKFAQQATATNHHHNQQQHHQLPVNLKLTGSSSTITRHKANQAAPSRQQVNPVVTLSEFGSNNSNERSSVRLQHLQASEHSLPAESGNVRARIRKMEQQSTPNLTTSATSGVSSQTTTTNNSTSQQQQQQLVSNGNKQVNVQRNSGNHQQQTRLNQSSMIPVTTSKLTSAYLPQQTKYHQLNRSNEARRLSVGKFGGSAANNGPTR